eukprot:scaffold178510_cov20-Tisochrysis_lutea.AAC.1
MFFACSLRMMPLKDKLQAGLQYVALANCSQLSKEVCGRGLGLALLQWAPTLSGWLTSSDFQASSSSGVSQLLLAVGLFCFAFGFP